VTFTRREHITRRADFEAVYQSGIKVSGRLMTMFVRANAADHPRLGIAATRRIGGAVVRNRAKRLTRELFRQYKPANAVDIVVVPRREFPDAPYSSLEREFDSLLRRAARLGRPARAGRDSRV
jgi:ribonuclease P protein component